MQKHSRTLIIIGALLTIAALFWLNQRRAYTQRTTSITGMVRVLTDDSVGVQPNGAWFIVNAPRVPLQTYEVQQDLAVRYDAKAEIPQTGPIGRVDGFRSLWLGPVVLLAAGVLVLLTGIMLRLRRRGADELPGERELG